MRMKEDHMLNGQLKPAYNLQISTNNQYIVNYSLHQTTADTTTLQEHTEIYKNQYNETPEVITADAAYGSAYKEICATRYLAKWFDNRQHEAKQRIVTSNNKIML